MNDDEDGVDIETSSVIRMLETAMVEGRLSPGGAMYLAMNLLLEAASLASMTMEDTERLVWLAEQIQELVWNRTEEEPGCHRAT